MFKPKFAPKIPVKSEPGEAQSSTNSQTAAADTNKTPRNDSSKEKHKGRKERDGDRERNSQHKGGRGGGRGQWTMPTGVSFFTGNAPAQLAAKMNQSITIPVKSEAAKPSSSAAGLIRVSRPNEAIDDFPTTQTTSSSDYIPPEPDLEDTDSDRSDEGDDVAHSSSEVWPPLKYNALDPLALPFGPKTAQLRKLLAQEAILAPPDDLEALDYEERTSLFLLQMPSDLRAAGAGRLGKLQLLRSGKVRLVTHDGKSFDVKNGLSACFMQSLMTVDVSEGEISTEAEQSAPPSKKGKEATGGGVTSEQGTMHFMGNVTKKVVLTPNYELGVRRKRSTSLSSQKAQRAAQEALLGRARAGSEVVGGEEELLAEEEFAAMDMMDVGE